MFVLRAWGSLMKTRGCPEGLVVLRFKVLRSQYLLKVGRPQPETDTMLVNQVHLYIWG